MSQTLNALVQLRKLILAGKLCAGDRVSEHSLVRRLNVSRTPIRAALQRLEGEGLCRVAVGGGYEINAFSMEEVVDAINVRGTLEGMAARCAAERGLRRADLASLTSCVTKMDEILQMGTFSMEDLAAFGQVNERFHSLFVHLLGNLVLQRVLQGVLALPFVSPSAFVTVQSQLPAYHNVALRGQQQHHDLVDAIEKGDGLRAEKTAREHADIAKGNIRAVMENQEMLKHVRGWSLIRNPTDDFSQAHAAGSGAE